MPGANFVEPTPTTPTAASKPSYNASMFETAEAEEVVIERVQNVAGPDRSQLFMMLAQKIITAEQFVELDKAIMSNNRANMTSANSEMFKGFKGKNVNAKDVANGFCRLLLLITILVMICYAGDESQEYWVKGKIVP
ncbi:hypothetical protein BDQ17DRAFT_1320884 [Cyathus striatus]|nr:hypothetical protein BDQ17DRAFT_1320884 [Cyathus striatus]